MQAGPDSLRSTFTLGCLSPDVMGWAVMKKQPNKKSSSLSFTRRDFKRFSCHQACYSVVCDGLPPAWFERHIAQAQTMQPPQTLILSTSSAGDPVNANCPGSYVEGIFNNPILESRVVSYGQTRSRAAAPWADLPGALRQRLAFVHHSSRSSAHPEHKAVMSFMEVSKTKPGMVAKCLLQRWQSCLTRRSHLAKRTIAAFVGQLIVKVNLFSRYNTN